MFESPEIHKFAESRIGRRTAHEILVGAKKVEDTFDIQKKVEKGDIYKVPSKVLQTMMDIGIIISEETRKTSAPMAFRIIPSSPTAIKMCLDLENENDTTLLVNLGK